MSDTAKMSDIIWSFGDSLNFGDVYINGMYDIYYFTLVHVYILLLVVITQTEMLI